MPSLLLILAYAALALAGLYAVVTVVNLAIFRAPRRGTRATEPVSILIPARDEADNIGAVLESVLAQKDAALEVVILDDGSSDGTGAIVERIAARDDRVRLIRGSPLPPGWNGKQHACHQLAQAARHPILLFLDADVRLAPDAVARMAGYLERRRLDLVSGFPRQITRTWPEIIVIPQILVLLLGYLPFPMARMSNGIGFAAGCGQLMMVRAQAYKAAGGHSAFKGSMHDGLQLPRNLRRSGARTDILDATPIAHVRMYDNWPDIWTGFSKNATEGMAKPIALPVWTILLGGGHVFPPVLLLASWLAGAQEAALVALWATLALLAARTALALVVRQHPLAVLLHPVGILVTLWIQWSALAGARRGEKQAWRGRSYDVN